MKPRIGVLTNFNGADSAFSLVNVVGTQLQMLMDGGYTPVLFVASAFNGDGFWNGSRFEVRKVAPSDGDSLAILDALRQMTTDIDVMLCHDITFLSQNSQWAIAVRELAKERPHLAWLHWQHSRGGHAPVEPMERSWYCYPNMGDLEHVAQINNAALDRVRYIPHPLDFGYLGWPELALRIAEDYQFPFVDVSGVLPARLDRQKQIEKALRVFAGLKHAGRSVSFLVADAYATGDHFIQYKREVETLAREQGLADREFAFLGENYEECRIATPRPVVKALFEMSNLFIQPSNAETSSLVAMEAALAGNLLLLNADFPPIHHLYKKALLLPFGSIFEDTKYFRHIKTADGNETKIEDAQAYFDDQARMMVIPALEGQLIQAVKRQQLRERWPSQVFSTYLQPLIQEVWHEVNPRSVEIDTPGDPEVTAIITTLDNCQILERQVPILLQECGQVIVVNNGSEDGTAKWLEDNPFPRMSYINRENKGAGPGRNAGLKMWDNSTPYTLMVDGGILPVRGAVAKFKDYLERHPEVSVISPEVASCFTTNEDEASAEFDRVIEDNCTFPQSYLSSTAFCLCRAEAWKLRFCEDGPFGQPGWGCDDNEMAYRWADTGIMHHDFTYTAVPVMFYRRASGSFARLFRETGVWPNQYGSVYEQRNVYLFQEFPYYHRGLQGKPDTIRRSYIVQGQEYPELAKTIKRLHDDNPQGIGYEIIVRNGELNQETHDWIEAHRLHFAWGDAVVDVDGQIIHRTPENEDTWTGDFMVNREPRGEEVIYA
jgi:glycosyltransferase involved in cell wall biosynthesis